MKKYINIYDTFIICLLFSILNFSNLFAQDSLITSINSYVYTPSYSKVATQNNLELTNHDYSNNEILNSIEFENVTLQKLIEIGLNNNLTYKNALLNYETANAQVAQSRSINSTKITGKFVQTRLDGVGSANIAGRSIKLGKEDVQKAYFEVAQPIYMGDKDHNTISISRKLRNISSININNIKQNIIYQISLAYYNWLYKREVVKVAKKDVDLAQAHYNMVKAKYENAQVSKFELLRAEVRIAQTEAKLVQEQNSENNAKLELIRLLFLPTNSKLNTQESLKFCDYTPNLNQDLEKIESNRPDLQIKKLELEISKYNINLAKSDKLPTVSVFGQAGSEDPSSKSGLGGPVKKGYWNVGITLELPILDGGLRKAKISETKTKHEIVRNSYYDLLQKAKIEVNQAYSNLQTASEMVKSQRKAVELAEEALRLAHIRYNNGMLTQVELFDAENAYLYANLQYISSIFAHHKERLNYLLLVGKLDEKQACFYASFCMPDPNNSNN